MSSFQELYPPFTNDFIKLYKSPTSRPMSYSNNKFFKIVDIFHWLGVVGYCIIVRILWSTSFPCCGNTYRCWIVLFLYANQLKLLLQQTIYCVNYTFCRNKPHPKLGEQFKVYTIIVDSVGEELESCRGVYTHKFKLQNNATIKRACCG